MKKPVFYVFTLMVVFGLLLSGMANAKQDMLKISFQKAGLNAQQAKLLRSLGVPVIAPSYLPEGFQLQFVIAKIGRGRFGGGPSYTLIYRSNKGEAFGIESTSGGIGGPPSDKRISTTNPVFGKVILLISNKGYGNGNVKPGFLSEWITAKGNFYHFIGAGFRSETRGDKNVSAKEALKILRSLRYVKI